MLADSILALALTLFFEARGTSEAEKRMVADVVITRLHSDKYPNDVVDVVLQPHQFSWTRSMKEKNLFGLISLQQRILKSKKYSEKDKASYRECERIAREVLRKGYMPRHKFTHFHSHHVRVKWNKTRQTKTNSFVFSTVRKRK